MLSFHTKMHNVRDQLITTFFKANSTTYILSQIFFQIQ